MPPRRSFTPPPPLEVRPPTPALSSDILFEIFARSDAATLFRCAATCKPLRRDILNPAFIRRVSREPGGIVPPCLLGFLDLYNQGDDDEPRPPVAVAFSLAHPATPAAASFSEKHLAPLLARNCASELVDRVLPLTSLNGLVLLFLARAANSSRRYSMAVYDPLAGKLTDFLSAPDIDHDSDRATGTYTYVLLTAADGIGCSFLVLAAEFPKRSRSIKVQTLSADAAAGGGGEWSAAASVRHCRSRGSNLQKDCTAVVLGGIIHWLMGETGSEGFRILTYDVRTARSIELPTCVLTFRFHRDIDLASSPDGRLSLLVADKLLISVWVLSSGSTGGGGWARHAVIDAEASVRSVMPEVSSSSFKDMVHFARSWSWAKSGAVLLQRPFTNMFYLASKSDEEGLVHVDVETKEMRKVTMKKNALPYEVDLESRLSAMHENLLAAITARC